MNPRPISTACFHEIFKRERQHGFIGSDGNEMPLLNLRPRIFSLMPAESFGSDDEPTAETHCQSAQRRMNRVSGEKSLYDVSE